MKLFKLFFAIIAVAGINEAHGECLKDVRPLFSKARDFFNREQYLLASQSLIFVGEMACESETRNEAHLRFAQSLFELGESGEAIITLKSIPESSKWFKNSKLVGAWYQPNLISTLPSAEKDRLKEWKQKLGELPREKAPWLSGTLSALLPGAGQVYNGNFQSALFSFALNALFLSTTIEFSREGLEAPALASGMVFSVVYLGNILGSIQSSREINTNAQRAQTTEMQRKDFPELSF